MRSTFYGFEVAKSGMFASQRSLDITGHNISNVNTDGYCRQELTVAAIPPPTYMGLIAYSDKTTPGQGVRMLYVDQVRDPFLDVQYRQENTASKYWETQDFEFSMVEQLFNFEITEDESGISMVFADFYQSLYSFVENPADLEIRQAIIGSAKNLIATMNQNADSIRDQYDDINEAIEASVGQINSLTSNIAALNNQIFSFELSGAKANDLRDQRNLLIDELSGYIPISYRETSEGYLIVQYQGQDIINHATSTKLALDSTKEHAFTEGAMIYEMYWTDEDGNIPQGATAITETEGIIGGYFKMRDGNDEENIGLPYVMNLLDNLCRRVAMDFNGIHVRGYSLPNGNEPSSQGNKLFADGITINTYNNDGTVDGSLPDGTAATNIYGDIANFEHITALNFSLEAGINEYKLAASDTEIIVGEDNEQRLNNLIALEIVEMLNQKDVSGNPDNFDSIYKDILVAVGLEMSHITTMNNNQAVVLANIQSNRLSVSAVSLDEEVTNMIKFGHSFNASSRMINAIDEQLDTIINRMGIVGR